MFFWTTINVIKSAIDKFVAAWNAHRIPGICVGVPNVLFGCAPQTTCLSTTVIPTTAEVIQLHQNEGGTLTEGMCMVEILLNINSCNNYKSVIFSTATLTWKRCFRMSYIGMGHFFNSSFP